jgi:hypothetical protein
MTLARTFLPRSMRLHIFPLTDTSSTRNLLGRGRHASTFRNWRFQVTLKLLLIRDTLQRGSRVPETGTHDIAGRHSLSSSLSGLLLQSMSLKRTSRSPAQSISKEHSLQHRIAQHSGEARGGARLEPWQLPGPLEIRIIKMWGWLGGSRVGEAGLDGGEHHVLPALVAIM